jgi:hypothetical protein
LRVEQGPPQEREIHYVRGFGDDGPATRITHESDAEQAWRSRYGVKEQPVRQVRFQVETTRETVVVPFYVPREQPAPRTIEDFQRDRNRGRAAALARHLEGVERNLDEDGAGATIKALSDEERDQAHRVVDKLKAALGGDEMDVEVPDQLN